MHIKPLSVWRMLLHRRVYKDTHGDASNPRWRAAFVLGHAQRPT